MRLRTPWREMNRTNCPSMGSAEGLLHRAEIRALPNRLCAAEHSGLAISLQKGPRPVELHFTCRIAANGNQEEPVILTCRVPL